MPLTNYRILKEIMTEKNKGFWKVQSIHKLSTKLSHRFNAKDFILMKNIQRGNKFIPPFISFSNESKKLKVMEKRSITTQTNPYSNSKIFMTNGEQENINLKKINTKREIKKRLYLDLFKDFPYEPYIYNELQFIYLQGKNKFIPRKFNEVVKDCFIMDKYNKYIINKKNSAFKTNDSNINTHRNYITLNLKNDDINDDKFTKTLSAEGKVNNFKIQKNIRIKTINSEIKKNCSKTLYEGFFKNKKLKQMNHLPSLGNKNLTERDI